MSELSAFLIPPFVARLSQKTYHPSIFPDDWPRLEGDKPLAYRQQLDGTSTISIAPSRSESPLIQSPSKFSDKVNTNYIPNTTERQEITEYVFTVKQELSELNARITEMRDALIKVIRTRDHLQTAVNQHQALISPLRRLPPELLQLIFVWCLPSHRNAVMHSSEAPVLLGRVCSEWRRISLATPQLWSSLHIVPPNVNLTNLTSSIARFDRKRELIEMWLGRSGACPLNISFVWFASD